MILVVVPARGIEQRGPRACGDDPSVSAEQTKDLWWTPRMRG